MKNQLPQRYQRPLTGPQRSMKKYVHPIMARLYTQFDITGTNEISGVTSTMNWQHVRPGRTRDGTCSRRGRYHASRNTPTANPFQINGMPRGRLQKKECNYRDCSSVGSRSAHWKRGGKNSRNLSIPGIMYRRGASVATAVCSFFCDTLNAWTVIKVSTFTHQHFNAAWFTCNKKAMNIVHRTTF